MTNSYRIKGAILWTKTHNLSKMRDFVRKDWTKTHKLYRLLDVQCKSLCVNPLRWTKYGNAHFFGKLSKLYRCCIDSFSSICLQNELQSRLKCPNHSLDKKTKKCVYLYEIYMGELCPTLRCLSDKPTPNVVAAKAPPQPCLRYRTQASIGFVCPTETMATLGSVGKEPEMKIEFPLRESDIERFKSKINKLENGCWRWKGPRNHKRGEFSIKAIGKQGNTNIPAHRFAWFESRGYMPDGQVTQTCGNTLCVNPNHLVLKTHENQKPAGHSEAIATHHGQTLDPTNTNAQRASWEATA
jgi:hypothetical protein